MTPEEQTAYNRGFAVGSGDEGYYQRRIATLEAALREIAAGLMPEDSAADHHNRYELCAARLCEIARLAITSETKAQPLLEESGPDDPEPRY